ncbi:glycosyltransferase family 4 protein [Paenibacillus alkalitolerans]|uniref:glycosyltransferase family 4 protein n=1 Tax=Paenibacillus alkalitolerans TaxID=2799335 RepID=UPI0018F5677F|nr:glycosyltransferase family 4 protein [Paenibacillus alkalitolerans]
MKILLATFWGVPAKGSAHTYIDLLRKGLAAAGHQVDLLSHDAWMNNILLNGNLAHSIYKAKIRDTITKELLLYFQRHYQTEVEDWMFFRELERSTYELSAAYVTDLNQYDIVHTQDIVSTRALSRILPAGKPLVATIHGLLVEEMRKQGQIFGKDSARWHYVAAEEHYALMSANVAVAPQWLKDEYQNNFQIPQGKILSEPYELNNQKVAVQRILKVYQSVLGK